MSLPQSDGEWDGKSCRVWKGGEITGRDSKQQDGWSGSIGTAIRALLTLLGTQPASNGM